MKTFDIDICGVTYKCKVGSRSELNISDDAQGECNVYSKEISVCSSFDYSFYKEGCSSSYMMEVIRHEISHALLYETGLITLACGEEMPEWLSVNSEKLEKYVKNFAALSLGEFDKRSEEC